MNYKIIGIFLISLFLFSNISSIYADDNSYSISRADFIIDVGENGILHIKESFLYSFDGEFNGVYREIPIKNGESLENIRITTDGAYSDYKISSNGEYYTIKIYLYADEAKTQKISNQNVKINIEYDHINAINIYNDIGELHYKIWGEEWDVDVGEVNAQINFKSADNMEYWINPFYNSANAHFQGNSLIIHSESIPSGEYLEVRSLIPLNQFNNPTFANHINENGIEKIKEIQESYKNQSEFENVIFSIIPIILILSLVVPVMIYLKFGREPKVSYSAIYEREPPSQDSPIFINAMFDGNVGSIDKKAFQAGVMDLINKKYLKLSDDSQKDDVKLIINNKLDFSSLKDYEMSIINLLGFLSTDNVIDFKRMKNTLSNETVAKEFSEKYNLWKSDYENIHVDAVIDNYFIDDGNVYLKIFSGILAAISFITIIASVFSNTPSSQTAMFIAIFFLLLGIILFLLPNKIAGRWTEYGMEENEKWQNFKKYLNDFSLIKEYPPSSIVIWEQYLVYATALGVAKTVKKAMEFHLPAEYLENNDLYYYNSYNGSFLLYSAISTGFRTASSSNTGGGGFGGPGGGSGGGGGGAF